MEYKEFTLDPFQIEAIEYLNKGNSVIVSAATGTGKTLIADYVINKYIQEGSKIVYTAPIKALSNQKFREFKEEYGDKIGLITGDIVINDKAQILIMTTEIYRNMLVTNDPLVNEISYVIFDEIHYINDIERGTVWEESIIFSPEHIRFLCLSATIPNAREFGDWIESIKNHTVDVVKYDKRAVPLAHYLYDGTQGLVSINEFKKQVEIGEFNNYSSVLGRKKSKKNKKNKEFSKPPSHIDLVKDLRNQEFLPAIYFIFSRKACEDKALELAKNLKNDFTTPEQKTRIIHLIHEHVDSEYNNLETVKLIKSVLPKGIAFHHAGLMPFLKTIVEQLFNEGLIKVLYATETFAVGINMPAKTVCFSSLEKYDGISFRYMTTKEYFQMAGRAGRRGIDKEGRSIALLDKNYAEPNKIINLMDKDVEPIISQFKLSYNTVLNLVSSYDNQMIATILKSSFDYFLRKKQNRDIRIMASYKNAIKRLSKMGYIDDENKITQKGEFARYIYQNEILITEIFYSDILNQLSEIEIICLLSSIVYEPRKNDQFVRGRGQQYYEVYKNILDVIFDDEFVRRNFNKMNLRKIIPLVHSWASGSEFSDLMELSSLREGDVIRLVRQCVDFFRQIIRATRDQEKITKLQKCMNMIYRDVMQPEF